ncbi:hypothetical protein AAFF_G00428660 [Aldrovandia affinis]|uniref:RING-CH-type domain-containing protein n=1 Tax=Aldrovandia affinis TaxID=143900 RepID=A0AAD7S933_9TELE|nr:hypothetical protein AAFF_G00428660 [Aldrovandia affinis]
MASEGLVDPAADPAADGTATLDSVQVKTPPDPSPEQPAAPPVQEVIDCGGHVPFAVSSPSTNSGTLATVHCSCLERWLTASNTSRCELCRFEFAVERLPKPLREWLDTPSMQHQRRTLCGDAICFLFITPLACLSGWLCVQGAMDLYYSNSMEAIGLIVLTLALFTIYLFWTIVSLRYHVHLFDTWKRTNQRVRLLIPRPALLPHCQRALPPHFSKKDTSKETVV